MVSNISHVIFGDFGHKDTVITFSGKSRMCQGNVLSKTAHSQVAHTTAAFTAGHSNIVKVPAKHGFGNAAQAKKFVLLALRSLVNVSGIVVHAVEGQSAAEKGYDGILLELVVKDRNRTLAFNTDRLALLSVFHCDIKAGLGRAQGNRGDANAAGEEALSDLEETTRDVLDIGLENTIFSDISVPIHHILTGNANIFVF